MPSPMVLSENIIYAVLGAETTEPAMVPDGRRKHPLLKTIGVIPSEKTKDLLPPSLDEEKQLVLPSCFHPRTTV